jgi:hypothetical protein
LAVLDATAWAIDLADKALADSIARKERRVIGIEISTQLYSFTDQNGLQTPSVARLTDAFTTW